MLREGIDGIVSDFPPLPSPLQERLREMHDKEHEKLDREIEATKAILEKLHGNKEKEEEEESKVLSEGKESPSKEPPPKELPPKEPSSSASAKAEL